MAATGLTAAAAAVNISTPGSRGGMWVQDSKPFFSPHHEKDRAVQSMTGI